MPILAVIYIEEDDGAMFYQATMVWIICIRLEILSFISLLMRTVYGKNVLDFCIGLQLQFLNGRTIGDTVGRPTFQAYNRSSIDDYCICSASS